MRASSVALAAVATLLLVAPTVLADGTSLYLHIVEVQDMPINPQAPPADFAVDQGFGAGTASLSCLPDTPGTAFNVEYHTLYGYATPGAVDYGRAGTAEPQARPERGLVSDVPLDGAKLVLHWYWSTEPAPGVGTSSVVPVVLPDVVVEATVRAGDQISVDDQAYNAGAILAQGRSQPALLAADQSQGVEHSMVGGRHVYHFEIPLEVKGPAIPAEGYNIRIDTSMVRDQCPADGYFTPNLLAMHSSPGHRPRLEISSVQQPAIESVEAVGANGSWLFPVVAASAWGPVDVANLTVAIDGPSQAKRVSLEDALDAGAPHPRRLATAIWDAAADGAEPGHYVAHVTASNLQGTAQASADVAFDIAGEKSAPAASPALVLLGLVGMALLLRRR